MNARTTQLTNLPTRLRTPGHSRACPAAKPDKLGVDPVGDAAARNVDERCDRRTAKVRTDAARLRDIMDRAAAAERTSKVGTWGTGRTEISGRVTPGVILVRNVN